MTGGGPPASGIRRYFSLIITGEDERNKKYMCVLCSAVVCSAATATSNLIKHMRRRHPVEYEKYHMENKKNGQVFPQSGGSRSSSGTERRSRPPEESQNANMRRLIEFLAWNLESSAVADCMTFRNFVNGLDSRFILPTKLQLNRIYLPQEYNDIKNNLEQLLAKEKGISVTLDILLDKYNQNYFVATAHYIDANWQRASCLLSCKMLNVPNVQQWAQSNCRDFILDVELSSIKVESVVIRSLNQTHKYYEFCFPGWEGEDNKRWMEGNYYENELQVLRGKDGQVCFAFLLRELVKEGLAECRNFDGFFRSISALVNTVSQTKFTWPHANTNQIFLPTGSIPNWQDQLKAMKRILSVPDETLSFVCLQSPDYNEEPFGHFQFDKNLLGELVEIFEGFDFAYDRVQEASGIACSQVIPIIRGLRVHLKSLKSVNALHVVSRLIQNLENRLAQLENVEWYQRASVLDPRFKTAWCSPEECTTIEEKLFTHIMAEAPSNEIDSRAVWTTPEELNKRPKLFSFMSVGDSSTSRAWVKMDMDEVVKEELRRYLSSPPRSYDTDPLQFWKGMEGELPILAIFARKCLSMVASLSPVDSVLQREMDQPSLYKGHILPHGEFEKLMYIRCNRMYLNQDETQ